MYATDAFDALVGHPAVLGLLRRLTGPDISITAFCTAFFRVFFCPLDLSLHSTARGRCDRAQHQQVTRVGE